MTSVCHHSASGDGNGYVGHVRMLFDIDIYADQIIDTTSASGSSDQLRLVPAFQILVSVSVLPSNLEHRLSSNITNLSL